MKDKLRELVNRISEQEVSASGTCAVSKEQLAELLAILDAEGDGVTAYDVGWKIRGVTAYNAAKAKGLRHPECVEAAIKAAPPEGDGGAVGEVPSGWEIRWHTEGDDSLLLITHRKHGGVGVHKDATDARTIPEEMLYLLARDLLTTKTHPARSGVVSDEDVEAAIIARIDRLHSYVKSCFERIKHLENGTTP